MTPESFHALASPHVFECSSLAQIYDINLQSAPPVSNTRRGLIPKHLAQRGFYPSMRTLKTLHKVGEVIRITKSSPQCIFFWAVGCDAIAQISSEVHYLLAESPEASQKSSESPLLFF